MGLLIVDLPMIAGACGCGLLAFILAVMGCLFAICWAVVWTVVILFVCGVVVTFRWGCYVCCLFLVVILGCFCWIVEFTPQVVYFMRCFVCFMLMVGCARVCVLRCFVVRVSV